jgi:hypothetical protein
MMTVTNFTAARTAGVPVQVLRFRDKAALGVTTLSVVISVLPDPALEETAMNAKSKLADALREQRALRDHATLRDEVQRFLRGSAKGRNVKPYANYIANGLRGEFGEAWSTPPLTLWSPRSIHFEGDSAYLPLGQKLVAIDGETQVAALHEIYNHPDAYRLDSDVLETVPIPFEIYWDIETIEARQIFRDRNLLGVAMPKNLALGMDSRDLGTIVAEHAATLVEATGTADDGDDIPFTELIERRKRQLGKADLAWVTLSAWRGLATTTLLGTAGIEATSRTLEVDDLDGADLDVAKDEAGSVMAAIVDTFPHEFSARSAITAPAVLAGIGALAYHTMPWAEDVEPMTRTELLKALRRVKWAREPQYWEGVAAKRSTTRDGQLGGLSFAGGIKDSAHRVYDALSDPGSELGRRIRGN